MSFGKCLEHGPDDNPKNGIGDLYSQIGHMLDNPLLSEREREELHKRQQILLDLKATELDLDNTDS